MRLLLRHLGWALVSLAAPVAVFVVLFTHGWGREDVTAMDRPAPAHAIAHEFNQNLSKHVVIPRIATTTRTRTVCAHEAHHRCTHLARRQSRRQHATSWSISRRRNR
jgi:hypothetical protein